MDREKALSNLHRKYPTFSFIVSQPQSHGELKPTSRIVVVCSIHGESSPLPLEAILYRRRVGCTCLVESHIPSDPLKFKKKRSLEDIQERVSVLYSKEEYKVMERVTINRRSALRCVCPVHGEFTVDMNRMLANKQSCPGCGELVRRKNLSLTHEQFIDRLPLHIKESYDLTHTKYVGALKDVTVRCRVHGDFNINAFSLSKGAGCKRCSVGARAAKCRSRGEKTFKRNLEKLKNSSDISLCSGTYLDTHSPATLTCSTHGEFRYIPALIGTALRREVSPCPFCNGSALCDTGIQKELEDKIFPAGSLILDGYSVAVQPMRIRCVRCEGTSYKSLADMRRSPFLVCLKCVDIEELKASGLPLDGDGVPHWFYVIELTMTFGPPLYKVGITARNPETRVKEFGINRKKVVGWKTLYTERHESKISAYLREQSVLSIYEYERNFNLDILRNGGNTEIIFTNPLSGL